MKKYDPREKFCQPAESVKVFRPSTGEHFLLSDLDQRSVAWARRARHEQLRREGRFRELVLELIAPDEEVVPEANGVYETRVVRRKPKGELPSQADLEGAVYESTEPLPYLIAKYMHDHHAKRLRRRRGPNTPPARSTWDEVLIVAEYQYALHKAKDIVDNPAERAKAFIARKFGVSVRALERILASRPLPNSRPK